MIPLAAAFALMAILLPSDLVAVNGIGKRVHILDCIMNFVCGDFFSALIVFKYSVAESVTGYFSLRSGIRDFRGINNILNTTSSWAVLE